MFGRNSARRTATAAAPTVSAFLARCRRADRVPVDEAGGELNGSRDVPSLPAAMTMSMSRRFAAYASTSLASTV